jgi:predicted aminopeptidase
MRYGRRILIGSAACGLLIAACSPGFVLRAGWEEARILADRRPIEEVIEDPGTPPEIRERLVLVREVRVFAERQLGLDAGRTFRSFTATDRDTLVLVVSAAPEFELRWKTWWFPVVGSLPYKGFFDFEAATAEADQLAREGYDTYVAPSAAFSTLGWFPDPVLTPALRGEEVAVTETVIHEVTHTTFYARGHSQFNESFANYVGHRGAIEYYCAALGESEPCRRAEDRWHDTRTFARFFQSIKTPLEHLYASDLGDAEMRSRKAQIVGEAITRFETDVSPALRSGEYALSAELIDNAWLMARLLYYERLDDFERLHERFGSVRPTVEALISSTADDPWSAMDALLAAE